MEESKDNKVSVKQDTNVFKQLSFEQVGVAPWLCKNLRAVGISEPTQIQQKTLLHSLKGKNIIGCAHTGSGKTACFALPILQKLAKDPYGIFGLVLTPTRELAY
jgi:ATP-dependent RNA helicase DDX49/DBP8